MTDFGQELNTSGLNCPMPVMETKKALTALDDGEVLHMISTDPATNEDIPKLCNELGCKLLYSEDTIDSYHFYIQKA